MKLQDILTEDAQYKRKLAAGIEFDQYFTRPEVAKQFATWVKSKIPYNTIDRIIEPSAGSGDILKHFPSATGYDISPRTDDIERADFLTTNIKSGPKTLVVGNPPFGKASDMALKFINHAAKFADYIAFILPKTFRKESIQNRVSNEFTLLDEWVLPRGSFYLPAEGTDEPYDVPAVAQIWVRQPREIKGPIRSSPHFKFVRKDEADVAILRKGRKAGTLVFDDISTTNPDWYYYVKATLDIDRVKNALNEVDWDLLGHDVVGSRSISQGEIVKAVKF